MRRLLPIGVVVLGALVVGSVMLVWPFGRDQGIHAHIASEMLGGKVVYRDVFNVKPPLTTVVHALAIAVFGHNMTALRFVDLCWLAATALLLFLLLRRLTSDDSAGVFAALAFALCYTALGWWHTAQTDGWLNLPLLGALLCAQAELDEGRGRCWLGFGILVATAACFKYTAALLGPLIAGLGYWLLRRDRRRALTTAVLALTGALMTLGVCILALVLSGALPAFIESQFGLMPGYTRLVRTDGSTGPLALFLKMLYGNRALLPTGILLAAGLVAIAVGLFSSRRRNALLLLLWIIAALASTWSQGKFFQYHYLPLLPAAAAAAGFGLAGLRLRRSVLRTALTAGLLLGLCLVVRWPTRLAEAVQTTRDRTALEDYWRSHRHDSGRDFSLAANLALVDWLRENTPESARVFIWGYEPMVYFLSRRPAVTRFLYNFPLIVNWQTGRFRTELVTALAASPPDFFIVEHGDATPWVTGHDKDSFETLLEFDELRGFIEANYRPLGQIARFDVFVRSSG